MIDLSGIIAFFGTPQGKIALSLIAGGASAAGSWLVRKIFKTQQKVAEHEARLAALEAAGAS